MKTKNKWISGISIGVVVCALGCYSSYRVYDAKQHYDMALSDLQKHEWSTAKSEFTIAKQQGLIAYTNGIEVYQSAVNQYGDKELKAAQNDFVNANFKQMEKDLSQIPSDSTAFEKSAHLKQIDPLKVNVSDYLPNNIKVDQVQYYMMTPQIPAIVVIGENQSIGNTNADVSVITYDPKTSSYKVGYSNDQQWAFAGQPLSGKLFGDNPMDWLSRLLTEEAAV